jgi:Mn-dependent DtxR family transcriptional regulator
MQQTVSYLLLIPEDIHRVEDVLGKPSASDHGHAILAGAVFQN